MLEIGLSLYSLGDVREFLRVHKPMDLVFPREYAPTAFLVLIGPSRKIVGHPDVQRSIPLTGQNIHKVPAPHFYSWMAGSSPAMTTSLTSAPRSRIVYRSTPRSSLSGHGLPA